MRRITRNERESWSTVMQNCYNKLQNYRVLFLVFFRQKTWDVVVSRMTRCAFSTILFINIISPTPSSFYLSSASKRLLLLNCSFTNICMDFIKIILFKQLRDSSILFYQIVPAAFAHKDIRSETNPSALQVRTYLVQVNCR